MPVSFGAFLLKPGTMSFTTVLSGASNEAGVPADSLFTRPRLEETVQASIRELDDALKKLGAINCNGDVTKACEKAI